MSSPPEASTSKVEPSFAKSVQYNLHDFCVPFMIVDLNNYTNKDGEMVVGRFKFSRVMIMGVIVDDMRTCENGARMEWLVADPGSLAEIPNLSEAKRQRNMELQRISVFRWKTDSAISKEYAQKLKCGTMVFVSGKLARDENQLWINAFQMRIATYTEYYSFRADCIFTTKHYMNAASIGAFIPFSMPGKHSLHHKLKLKRTGFGCYPKTMLEDTAVVSYDQLADEKKQQVDNQLEEHFQAGPSTSKPQEIADSMDMPLIFIPGLQPKPEPAPRTSELDDSFDLSIERR